jgi:hypothetical protein
MDVVKVNLDVAFVVKVIHVCYKILFSMFHLFFRSMLQVCLFGCCICCTHMLQLFYLDIAYGLQRFSSVFASVLDACFKCSIYFQTYVTSVAWYFKSRSGVASPSLSSIASPSAVLHPSQTAEGVRRGPMEGACQGITVRTLARALPFCYEGRNWLPLDFNWWVEIPLSLPAQTHVLSHGWPVGAASGRTVDTSNTM